MAEYNEARESAKQMAPDMAAVDFAKNPELAQFDQNIKGLENLAEKLNETQKKILGVILTDFSDDPEAEAEKDVFKKLRMACARAGMLDKKKDQIEFFKTLADPQFMNVVRSVGTGLIGIYIVPVVSKVIQQALEGDKTSQRWVLEMSGLKQDKFGFYADRWQLTHSEVNINQLNIDGKTDDELKRILAEVSYDAEAESVSDRA